MSEAAHALERGVRDDLAPALKGVARAVDKAVRSVARGIEGVVERIEAVEAHIAGQLAKIGSKPIRATLISAWSSNQTTNSLAPPADDQERPDQPAPDDYAPYLDTPNECDAADRAIPSPATAH